MKALSEELLERCSREQLVIIAKHFKLDVGDKRMKENVRGLIKANLTDLGVLLDKAQAGHPVVSSVLPGDVGLTFEQRQRLLSLQLKTERVRTQADLRKLELEVQKMRLQAVSGHDSVGSSGSFDVFSKLRLIPQFNERDPDTYFFYNV